MTKAKQSERDEYIAKLRATLKPGDVLHTVLREVSRSGMSRVIDVYKFGVSNQGTVEKQWLSYWVAKACGFNFQRNGREGIKIGGCGTDMGFEIIYNLGRVLYPDGFQCPGESCVSNEHFNDRNCKRDTSYQHKGDGGYALKQEWL
jgi:hypothetical protein